MSNAGQGSDYELPLHIPYPTLTGDIHRVSLESILGKNDRVMKLHTHFIPLQECTLISEPGIVTAQRSGGIPNILCVLGFPASNSRRPVDSLLSRSGLLSMQIHTGGRAAHGAGKSLLSICSSYSSTFCLHNTYMHGIVWFCYICYVVHETKYN